MRLSCEFKTDKIPLANRMMFVSIIKEALKATNKDYYEKIYLYKDKKNKSTKNFTFSFFIKDFSLKGEVFEIKDKLLFNISTPDYEFGINLYNGLLQLKTFKYNGYTLERDKITICKEKAIVQNQLMFRTLSPIFIKDTMGKALDPKDSEYLKELNYISNVILKNYRGYGLKEELQFKEIKMKKVVVKEEIKDFSNLTNKKYLYVNSYSGTFMLKGNIEDLRDLYMSGIGFKRNQGFGMIDII